MSIDGWEDDKEDGAFLMTTYLDRAVTDRGIVHGDRPTIHHDDGDRDPRLGRLSHSLEEVGLRSRQREHLSIRPLFLLVYKGEIPGIKGRALARSGHVLSWSEPGAAPARPDRRSNENDVALTHSYPCRRNQRPARRRRRRRSRRESRRGCWWRGSGPPVGLWGSRSR